MISIIWISGQEDILRGLRDIDGLDIKISSGRTLDSGARRVTAYATDAAIVQVQNRGLTVEVVVDGVTLANQTEALFAQIQRVPGETIDPGAP
jgi:hypothetical protein